MGLLIALWDNVHVPHSSSSSQACANPSHLSRGTLFRSCQTSLSESGQSKALVVLDAATWAEKETIPLDIGRRFFRVKGDDQPLPEVGEVVIDDVFQGLSCVGQD